MKIIKINNFEGIVIDYLKQIIRILLEIRDNQEKNKNVWHPWTGPDSEMPNIGEKVLGKLRYKNYRKRKDGTDVRIIKLDYEEGNPEPIWFDDATDLPIDIPLMNREVIEWKYID